MADAKVCTRCGETKPISEFRLLDADDPEPKRHSHCNACRNAAKRDAYRRKLEATKTVHAHRNEPRPRTVIVYPPRKPQHLCPICYGLPH